MFQKDQSPNEKPDGKTPHAMSANGEESEGDTTQAPVQQALKGIHASGVVPIKDTTRTMYERIILHMIRHSRAKRSSDPLEPAIVSPLNLVDDLWERRGNGLESSTFSTYRAALMWHLAQHRGSQPYEQAWAKLQELVAATADMPRARRKRSVAQTIPENDLRLLVEELTARSAPKGSGAATKTRWAYRANYWLLAGLATGLRPVEWASARWADEEHTRLLVTNAKVKLLEPAFIRAQRAEQAAQEEAVNSEEDLDKDEYLVDEPIEREVPVNSRDRFNVETHMRLLEQWLAENGAFEDYYHQTRRAIWRACHKLWDGRKRYSLYTMRSQYSANSRASVGSARTAELMGHSRADSPSTSYYGKANQSHAGYKRQPGAVPPITESMTPALPSDAPTGAAAPDAGSS
jgi:hypothetical protein